MQGTGRAATSGMCARRHHTLSCSHIASLIVCWFLRCLIQDMCRLLKLLLRAGCAGCGQRDLARLKNRAKILRVEAKIETVLGECTLPRDHPVAISCAVVAGTSAQPDLTFARWGDQAEFLETFESNTSVGELHGALQPTAASLDGRARTDCASRDSVMDGRRSMLNPDPG